MAEGEIHVGDIGTVLRVTVQDDDEVVDLSTATIKIIYLEKPAGTKLTKTAVFTTDGSDGKIQYVTIAGDLDAAGWWKIQAHVTLPAGSWYSDWQPFRVHANL